MSFTNSLVFVPNVCLSDRDGETRIGCPGYSFRLVKVFQHLFFLYVGPFGLTWHGFDLFFFLAVMLGTSPSPPSGDPTRTAVSTVGDIDAGAP